MTVTEVDPLFVEKLTKFHDSEIVKAIRRGSPERQMIWREINALMERLEVLRARLDELDNEPPAPPDRAISELDLNDSEKRAFSHLSYDLPTIYPEENEDAEYPPFMVSDVLKYTREKLEKARNVGNLGGFVIEQALLRSGYRTGWGFDGLPVLRQSQANRFRNQLKEDRLIQRGIRDVLLADFCLPIAKVALEQGRSTGFHTSEVVEMALAGKFLSQSMEWHKLMAGVIALWQDIQQAK